MLKILTTSLTDAAETPIITLAVAPTSVLEDGKTEIVYTFKRTGDTSSDLTVYYTVGGTADGVSQDKDYTGINKNSVTFKKGENTTILSVKPQSDKIIEADETVEITLAPGIGYDIGTSAPVISTITNDDGTFIKPSISVTLSSSAPTAPGLPPGSVLEDSQEKLIYTFKRTGDTSNKLTVNFTVGGTASGNDSTGSYSVTFKKGEDTANFTVVPIIDDVDEENKTVVLTLEKDKSYDISTPDALTGTIIDDDAKIPAVGEAEDDYTLSGSSLKSKKDKTKNKLPPSEKSDVQITSNAVTTADNPADNPILTENQKVGVPNTIWDAPISDQIEGFATDFSVDNGATVNFKINVSNAGAPYYIEIYRLGYYGGAGATLVTTINNLTGTAQPAPITDARGVVDAGNWSVSASWTTPGDAVSGVYLAKLVREDNGATNQIPFIVRQDEARADGTKSDIIFQTSDTTWHAYNGWGGNNGQIAGNFYGDFSGTINHPRLPDPGLGAQNRSYAVSYNRPFLTRDGGGAAAGAHDYLFGADYAAIYWLEKNGYDVSYISGVDSDRGINGGVNPLLGHKAYISVGHDEYWSGDQRDNVKEARDAGVNLLFWSGNEVYWKTRWENSISADGKPYRTLVSYKETWANGSLNAGPDDYANIDPSNQWTGTWRDLRFVGNPGAIGQEPENSLTGQLFGPDGTGEFGALDIPAPFAGLRVWRDTTVATTGQLDIATGILGYEWNTSPEDAYRPAGLIKLSDTTIPWGAILIDQGNRVAPGIATHNLTLYRDAESNALVFGAGTVFWSWGLSDQHDSTPYGANIENTALQQFTVNLFADMGIQPGVTDAFLASQGLTRATGTTDIVPATATLNNIANEVPAFSTVSITGTATDANGKVAAVEISLDGGNTWEVAQTSNNWANWSYNWQPRTQGTYTIQARAIDDSLNMANITPAADTVTVTPRLPPTTFSIFDSALSVTGRLENDNTPVELGMRFNVSQVGLITELKYYRDANDANDTDVRSGHLWTADGTLLATATFNSGPGQSGWQVATLSNPFAVVPGEQYVVSYKTNNNYFSKNAFFTSTDEVTFDGLDNDAFSDPFGKVRAPQSDNGNFNGVYKYGTELAFPDETYQAANYWVDVTFDPNVGPNNPPEITSGDFSVPENQTAVGTVTGTDPENNPIFYAIAGGDDAARFNINTSSGELSFIGAPNFEAPVDANNDNIYELILSASDNISPPVTQTVTVTVTDVESEPSIDNISLFNPSQSVTAVAFNDNTALELGMKFSVDRDGEITGLKYYRGTTDASDTDVREGRLWRVSDNALLGTVSFNSGPGQSGWQDSPLTNPVPVVAGEQYIVSYRTNNNYLSTNNFFSPANEVTFDGVNDDAFTDPLGVISAPQSTVVSGGGISGNGVYQYGTAIVMPNQTYNASNYWVDVLFSDPT